VRAEVFPRVGMFDASYVNGCDTDWLFRAREAGVTHGLVDEPLLVRRVHEANNSHQTEVSRAEYFRALHASIRRRKNPPA
jgi:GT2 family glycosyltransferase